MLIKYYSNMEQLVHKEYTSEAVEEEQKVEKTFLNWSRHHYGIAI
jgi:hypothetical protein